MKTYKIITEGITNIVTCETLIVEPNGRTFFKTVDKIVHIAPQFASINNVCFENKILKELENLSDDIKSDYYKILNRVEEFEEAEKGTSYSEIHLAWRFKLGAINEISAKLRKLIENKTAELLNQ